MTMKKAIVAFLAAAAIASPALARDHNPTPPEGYRNHGQCVSALAKARNDVRKNPEAYDAQTASDINNARCEAQPDGRFRIIF